MISDLFSLCLFLLFILFGFSRPYIALCGLVWVDNFRPQELSVSFLQGKPLSAVITLFFLFSLVINVRKIKVPKSAAYHFFVAFFLFWITLTTYFSYYPELAWFKHDSAFKTVLAAYFIPFVLTSKKQLEAFIWICIITFGTLSFFAGVKTLLGGGGYAVNLIGNLGGSFWSEGSTLATMCVAITPICLIGVKTLLARKNKLMSFAALGYALASILAVVGTQARTGLVCLVMYSLLLLKASKSKFKVIFFVSLVGASIIPFLSDSWFNRMSTISSQDSASSDTSAMGRVVVWRWTFDFVADNPILGGGFYAYRENAGLLSKYSKGHEVGIETPYPKAWHNVFIEVLGTQGYIGFAIFISMLIHTFLLNYRMQKDKGKTLPQWKLDVAKALNVSLILYCTGGMFVNIAFYPWIYYLYGLTVALYYVPNQEGNTTVETRN